jgi:hypothetical protein
MKTNEEVTKEWYDMIFSYSQLKDITTDEKQTLITYFDGIDTIANGLYKQHIFDRLEKIIWELVWGLDNMTIWCVVNTLQEAAAAIWILNDKKLPYQEWLIDNYLDYWIENPKRMCEPLFTDGSDGKNLHEATGNAGFRFINKYAIYAVDKMKETI